MSKNFVRPAGLEPAIDSLEGCCIIHYATDAYLVPGAGLEPALTVRRNRF
jgi:hypothetical protein